MRTGIIPIAFVTKQKPSQKSKNGSRTAPRNVKNILILALVGLINVLSLGALSAAPQVGDVYTTAEKDMTATLGRHSVQPAMVGLATIDIVPVLTVHPTSPGFSGTMANLFADAESGQGLEVLPFGTLPATPANYSVIDRKVRWPDFAYSTSTPMVAGVLNPLPPFQDEKGLTIGWFVTFTSVDGTDSLSLVDARFDSVSNDPQSTLGSSMPLLGRSYSEFARGYKADGTVVQTGSGTEMVSKVRLFFFTPLYNGGGTQNGLGEIQTYIEGFPNFALTATVTLSNGQSDSRTVETNPSTTVPAPVISIAGSKLTVVRGFGNLEVVTGSVNGTWVPLKQVSEGDVYDIPAGDQFFRVVRQ